MTQSPYLIPGRLQQLLAAIQFMSTYKFYRLTADEWGRAMGYLGPVDWEAVFKAHPELFRESPSKPRHYSLLYRRAMALVAGDNRPPLHDTQIHRLIDLALRLHADATGIRFHGHAVDRSPVPSEPASAGEKPMAFICHDARDRTTLALSLFLEMERFGCNVKFEEYSLSLGQSLASSVEKGLRECKKCILLVTPNLMKEGGWTKQSYTTIFTAELVRTPGLILPVLLGAKIEELREYSPLLASLPLFEWSGGVEEIAVKLIAAIVPKSSER